MKIDLNAALVWGAITATVSAVLWMFATFATAAEVDEIKLSIAYGQYYDRLDDFDELAEEYARQMERLKATICEADPEWERCNDDE